MTGRVFARRAVATNTLVSDRPAAALDQMDDVMNVVDRAPETMTDHELVATVKGRGQRVLFVHGLAASARYWRPIADRLPSDLECRAVDLLGFGQSPKPSDSSYDVDAHLDALEPHLADDTILVAHSTGAIVAVALARRHPRMVRSLVLTGYPLYPDPTTAAQSIRNLSTMTRWTIDGDPRARRLCAFMCKHRRAAAALAPYFIRDLPTDVAIDGTEHRWHSYERTLRRVVVDHSSLDDLRTLDLPVSIIQGIDDHVAPPDMVRRVLDRAGTASASVELVAVPGDHHVVHRTPQVIVDSILEFGMHERGRVNTRCVR